MRVSSTSVAVRWIPRGGGGSWTSMPRGLPGDEVCHSAMQRAGSARSSTSRPSWACGRGGRPSAYHAQGCRAHLTKATAVSMGPTASGQLRASGLYAPMRSSNPDPPHAGAGGADAAPPSWAAQGGGLRRHCFWPPTKRRITGTNGHRRCFWPASALPRREAWLLPAQRRG